LRGVTFVAGASATVLSGNVLDVVVNAVHYDLQLDPTKNYSGTTFHVTADGFGGSEIETIVVVSSGQTLVVPVGQTWFDTIINSGGTLQVSGTVSGTLNSGTQQVFGSAVSGLFMRGTEVVRAGGVTTATTLSSGATQIVSSGGIASS